MSMSFPIGSALFSSTLCVYGCHLVGMRGIDLVLAGIVAGVVAGTTAMIAVLAAGRREQRVRRR